MNILRLVYEWPPPWHGLAPGPYELSRAQASQNHSIHYLCGGWPRRPIVDPGTPNISVRRLPAALPGVSLFATTAPAAWAATTLRAGWADLIHGHGHLPSWLHAQRRWLPVLKERRIPYVLHLHVTAAGRAAHARAQGGKQNFWTNRVEWPLHRRSDAWGCATAEAIICVSESVREEAVRFYNAPEERLHVVPNGVNSELFRPQGEDRRDQLGLRASDRVIIFVGSLNKRKRPELLVQALPHLPAEWKVVMIGDGPLKEPLLKQAKELKVGERLILAGSIPYPDLPAYYRTADVFALTAAYEGFPKVVLEALASGVPVITTPSFSPDPLITPYLTIVSDLTGPGISRAIETAADLPVDVGQIDTHFSWRSRAEKIEKIYDQIRR